MKLILSCVAAAVACHSLSAASAATLGSGPFDAALTVDTVTVTGTGTPDFAQGTRCEFGFGNQTNCDIAVFPVDPTEPEFLVDWIDGDSFEVTFRGNFSGGPAFVEYTLSGLSFLVGNVASDIIGVTFNRALSRLDEYLIGNPAAYFNDPALSFTKSSVTVTFADFSDALNGDFPVLRYDVQVAGVDVAPVPLPPAAGLLAGALVVLGAIARRKRAA